MAHLNSTAVQQLLYLSIQKKKMSLYMPSIPTYY